MNHFLQIPMNDDKVKGYFDSLNRGYPLVINDFNRVFKEFFKDELDT